MMIEIINEELDWRGLQADVCEGTKPIDNIYQESPFLGERIDMIGVCILVQTTADCYQVLGVLHSKWRHIPERLNDFIGLSKVNASGSLHTTIRKGGYSVEIQIRTFERHNS